MKIISLMALLIFTSSAMVARNHEGGLERNKAMKIALITEKLELTTGEAKLFWPVYEQYQKDKKSMMEKHRESLHKTKEQADKLTDKDFQKQIEENLTLSQERVDLQKKYAAEFQKVIPAKKIILLIEAERESRRYREMAMKHHDRPEHENHRRDSAGHEE